MKTKKQIEHFLARKKYKSEIDFDGINLYCKNKFGIKLHQPSSYVPEPTDDIDPLDYATFADWLENGYGAGDVVEWGENIGLVQSGGTKEVKIGLKIDRNGPNFDPFVVNEQLIHPAGESAVKRIYEALDKEGKEFGNPFFVIRDKYVPDPCNIVTFQNHKTGKEGVGVVRIVNRETGEITMYCWYIKGEPVRYSMNEYLGLVTDYSFQQVQPADYPRKALDVALAKVGKTWNHFLKRIEPIKMQVEKGSSYWYISDKRTVEKAVEKGTPNSHKRYLAGNYFRYEDDAFRILEEENELRRNFLAEPERDLPSSAK